MELRDSGTLNYNLPKSVMQFKDITSHGERIFVIVGKDNCTDP